MLCSLAGSIWSVVDIEDLVEPHRALTLNRREMSLLVMPPVAPFCSLLVLSTELASSGTISGSKAISQQEDNAMKNQANSVGI